MTTVQCKKVVKTAFKLDDNSIDDLISQVKCDDETVASNTDYLGEIVHDIYPSNDEFPESEDYRLN